MDGAMLLSCKWGSIRIHGCPLSLIIFWFGLFTSEKFKVSDLITANRLWKSTLILSSFNEEEAKLILHLPLAPQSQNYQMVWHYINRCIYSVCSGYRLASELRWLEQGVWVHQMRLLSSIDFGEDCEGLIWWEIKVKQFLWRVFKGAIPCNANLFRRHIIVSPSCSICGDEFESINHGLWMLCCKRGLKMLCYGWELIIEI